MADSNEFRVEVQQEGGCWQPANVFNYLDKKNVVCVYLKKSPQKDISFSLEKVRWPRETVQTKQIALQEKAQVEYCEKHDDFINNGIYSWITGEVIEVNKENCLIQTSEEQTLLPKSQLFAYDPKVNFRDKGVRIYTSCIEVVGELKSIPLNLENIKSICQEVHALRVRYIEKEEKLYVFSIDPHTSDLCTAYQKKQCESATETKNSPPEEKPHSGAKLHHTRVLEIDIRLMGLALGTRQCNIGIARSTDGIESITLKHNSFTVVGTSKEAVETAVQILDVISVFEEIPFCNKQKAKTVQRDLYKWRLQQVDLLEENSSTKKIKVNLVGRRTHVDEAIKYLQDTKLQGRLGEKNIHKNHRSFQTPNFQPFYRGDKPHYQRFNSDSSKSYKRSYSSASQDSEPEFEFSPVTSPPETFPSSAKTLAAKPNNNNNNTSSEQLATEPVTPPSVPYRAKLKMPHNLKSDSPEFPKTDKPSKETPVLHKQNSTPNGYRYNCSTPPVQSNKYDPSNTKNQARPKTSGRTNQHYPRSISSIEFLPSTLGGRDEDQCTRGNAHKKHSQQRKKYTPEASSPLKAPNEGFPDPQENLSISCNLVFNNSDTPTDQQEK